MAAAALVPSAVAQEPGVIYEPGSPSDKEYAIPLEEARRDAGGGRPGTTEALAFGIGISSTAGSRGGSGGRETGGRRTGSAKRTDQDSARPGSKQAPGLAERLADAEDAGAATIWKLGPLLIVLLPALLVALLLARRGSGEEPAT